MEPLVPTLQRGNVFLDAPASCNKESRILPHNHKKTEQKEEAALTENSTVSKMSHVLFGNMMKEALIPTNLEVESNYEIGKGPPKLDVLIIRRTSAQWTKNQLAFLPDGIRQSHCKHVILELKYTESINQIAIFQALGYISSYVQLKTLPIDQVCAFIASSKTPQAETLIEIGFEPTDIKGVYVSKIDLLN